MHTGDRDVGEEAGFADALVVEELDDGRGDLFCHVDHGGNASPPPPGAGPARCAVADFVGAHAAAAGRGAAAAAADGDAMPPLLGGSDGETSGGEASGDEASGGETSGDEASGGETSGGEASGDEAPAPDAPARRGGAPDGSSSSDGDSSGFDDDDDDDGDDDGGDDDGGGGGGDRDAAPRFRCLGLADALLPRGDPRSDAVFSPTGWRAWCRARGAPFPSPACLAVYRPLSAAWLCLTYWRRGFLAKRAAAAAAGRPLVVLVFVGDAPREAHPELWAEFLGLALSGRPGAREALDLRVCGDGVGPGLDGAAVEFRAGGKVGVARFAAGAAPRPRDFRRAPDVLLALDAGLYQRKSTAGLLTLAAAKGSPLLFCERTRVAAAETRRNLAAAGPGALRCRANPLGQPKRRPCRDHAAPSIACGFAGGWVPGTRRAAPTAALAALPAWARPRAALLLDGRAPPAAPARAAPGDVFAARRPAVPLEAVAEFRSFGLAAAGRDGAGARAWVGAPLGASRAAPGADADAAAAAFADGADVVVVYAALRPFSPGASFSVAFSPAAGDADAPGDAEPYAPDGDRLAAGRLAAGVAQLARSAPEQPHAPTDDRRRRADQAHLLAH